MPFLELPIFHYDLTIDLLEAKVKDESEVEDNTEQDNCNHGPAVAILKLHVSCPIGKQEKMNTGSMDTHLIKNFNSVLDGSCERHVVALINNHEGV